MTVREAFAVPDRIEQRRSLAHQPEALIQPGWFAVFLAEWSPLTPERRKAILIGALNRKPVDFRALMTLGGLARTDRELAAEQWYRAALAIRPTSVAAWISLGATLAEQGNAAGAIDAYHTALKVDPDHTSACNGLAWVFAAGPDGVRDGRRAVEYATRACELTGWNRHNYIATLAAAYAETGDFDRAAEYQTKALSLPDLGKRVVADYRHRLALYAQKHPYRDPGLARPPEPAPPPREVKK
jgi:tetratricopeptide (TPR) repeat protein